MKNSIEYAIPQTRTGDEQEQSHGQPWARVVVHYGALIVSVLELVTLLLIIAFRQTSLALGGAVVGLLAIIVLMGMKAKLDSSEEAHPHISRAQ